MEMTRADREKGRTGIRQERWVRSTRSEVVRHWPTGSEGAPRTKGRVYFLQPRLLLSDDQLAERFCQLAHRWEDETRFLSSVQEIAMHEAYQHIIGLGRQAIPLILTRLKERPALWFWALNAITGENPADNEDTIKGAAQAWLEWGIRRGYVEWADERA
jgi:hypothetical protein